MRNERTRQHSKAFLGRDPRPHLGGLVARRVRLGGEPVGPQAVLQRPQVRAQRLRRRPRGEVLHDPPVDDVAEHGLEDLLEDEHDVLPQPLVPLAQVEHLVHEQEDDPQRDVALDGGVRDAGARADHDAGAAGVEGVDGVAGGVVVDANDRDSVVRLQRR